MTDTDDLVEIVAKALCCYGNGGSDTNSCCPEEYRCKIDARAALTALEASGWRVVRSEHSERAAPTSLSTPKERVTMTEDEAKTKWCPFARVWTPADEAERQIAGWNRMPCGGTPADTTAYRAGCEMREVNCIGSACMAWRWSSIYAEETHGFCGLAGSPLLPR